MGSFVVHFEVPTGDALVFFLISPIDFSMRRSIIYKKVDFPECERYLVNGGLQE